MIIELSDFFNNPSLISLGPLKIQYYAITWLLSAVFIYLYLKSNEIIIELGGELINGPGKWLAILNNISTNGTMSPTDGHGVYCVEIAESIGTLARCMCGEQRELFLSNKHWHGALPNFVALVTNLAMKNNDALPILIQYEGLIDFMLQCIFFDDYRPDIVEEASAYGDWGKISDRIFGLATRFIVAAIGKFPGGNEGIKEFGSKAIVSKSYDPYCTVTLTRGLLGLIKATDEKEFKVVLYFAVNELICAGCVDSLVIEAVTDLANSASDNWDVTYLPRILHKMLFDWDSVNGTQALPKPIDARFADAINAGLLQSILMLALNFGDQDHNMLMQGLEMFVAGATIVSFYPRSSEAIDNVRQKVIDTLGSAEMMEFARRSISHHEFIVSMKFIVDFYTKNDEVRCASCSTAPEKAMRCSRCKMVVYCSRQCQKDHWKAHKKDCQLAGGNITQVERGRRRKLVNEVVAERFFWQDAYNILKLATEQSHEMLDCIAIVNFCNTPPTVEVELTSNFLLCSDYGFGADQPDHASAKKEIARNKSKGGLTCACISFSPSGSRGEAMATLINFSGTELPQGSWIAAQDEIAGEQMSA